MLTYADRHCFHCQLEDKMCNGTNRGVGEALECQYQGCLVGVSLCTEIDPCELWYGRCFQKIEKKDDKVLHKCWACMDLKAEGCLGCTPGFAILHPVDMSRRGADKAWALTRGNVSLINLPKWYAPLGVRGPCEAVADSVGGKGVEEEQVSYPTADMLSSEADNFPADDIA
jgi:hypothetical protein